MNDTLFESADIIRPWQDTLVGTRECISEQNEKAWKETLLLICQGLAAGAPVGTARCSEKLESQRKPDWVHSATKNIELLWVEERLVATAVSESILRGVEF